MSRDVLAISRLFLVVYIKRQDFLFIQKVECSKKALFCGDCCDRNQAIILVVLIFVSP